MLSKDSLKIYSSRNGRLLKYLDTLGGDSTNYGDLTAMCLDEKQRKVYIGDSRGKIRVFNVNNGVLLQEMNRSDDVMQKLNESGPRLNKELCAIKFFS